MMLAMPLPPTDVRRYLLSLVESVAADQHPEFGGGSMSAVAYDTAWVAMVRDPEHRCELAFPRSFEWLLRHQAVDGSWSGPFPHTLLPTLAGLLALLRAPRQTQRTIEASLKAETYLRSSLARWFIEDHESVGFEVVAPALLEELERFGMHLDFPARGQLLELHAKKLAITGLELVYSGQSNLIHSLEAFGSSLDFARLKRQQAANGAYGCSPAATAAVLIYAPEWDAAAARWLSQLTERAFDGEPGGMPNAYPIDAFEAAWVLYNLAQAGFEREVPALLMRRLSAWLQGSLTSKGASISRFSGIPFDSDDTGMVVAALNLAGVPTSANSLRQFERDTHFACFERERSASLSANAHTLAALVSLPPSEQIEWAGSITKLIDFLYGVRRSDGFWEDKWHVSPYYATACTVLALAECSESSVRSRLAPTIEWVLETRSERDGGWGAGEASTLEETAYALQVLLAVPDLTASLRRAHYDAAIAGGRCYLREHLDSCMSSLGIDLPRLWRGKELYTPARVVMSAVLATVGATAGALVRGS